MSDLYYLCPRFLTNTGPRCITQIMIKPNMSSGDKGREGENIHVDESDRANMDKSIDGMQTLTRTNVTLKFFGMGMNCTAD